MQDDTTKQIIQRMRNLRLGLGYSYQDLAHLTGMSKSTLQRYERGDINNIPISKLETLADALQTSPLYLMNWAASYDENIKKAPTADTAVGTIRQQVNNILARLPDEALEKVLNMLLLLFEEEPKIGLK